MSLQHLRGLSHFAIVRMTVQVEQKVCCDLVFLSIRGSRTACLAEQQRPEATKHEHEARQASKQLERIQPAPVLAHNDEAAQQEQAEKS